MILRVRIGRWRITFTIAPVLDVIGVHSKLEDGNHILMWDFDDITLENVTNALQYQQLTHALPNIYIFNTGTPNHYIAYCFARCSWRYAIAIIASTPGIDLNFFKYGIYREKFTLRVTPKYNKKINLACVLESETQETAKIADLQRWVQYETLDTEYKHPFRCPGCKDPLKHCITIGE